MSARTRARALLSAASPGPWSFSDGPENHDVYSVESGSTVAILSSYKSPDAALIAAAPSLLAALADELDAKDAALDAFGGALSAAEGQCARQAEVIRELRELLLDVIERHRIVTELRRVDVTGDSAGREDPWVRFETWKEWDDRARAALANTGAT